MQPPPPRGSRVPRSSLFYFALVVVLGVVFFFTYQATQGGSGGSWTYTQLTTQAQAGNVKSITITGNQGVAIDNSGQRHSVNLPSDTAPVAATLAQEGVDVRYSSAGSATFWAQVLVPNLILVALIGGFLYFLMRRRRRL